MIVGFTQTIVRRRQMPGDYNDCGVWVPGAVVETELAASVQPLSVEDKDLQEGARLSELAKIYVPQEGALAAAFDQAGADRVIYDGHDFVVQESRSWPGGHCRATLLRES